MKLLILFSLLTQFSCAQVGYFCREEVNDSIDSLILGDWYLNQVDVVDGYNEFADSNRFSSGFERNKKITFTKDSLINYRDTNLRYYTRVEDYSYRVEYDSLFRRNDIKLLLGKKRKQREVESYQIIHCSENDLVIKSYQSLSSGLDNASFSVIYVYRREQISELSENLKKGRWFYCSEEPVLLFSDIDTLSYEFSQSEDDFDCDEWDDHHVHLSFYVKDYLNLFFWGMYSGVLGGGSSPHTYSLNSENNLLFVDTTRPFVYNIFIQDEKLILSLNKEETDKIRKKKNID